MENNYRNLLLRYLLDEMTAEESAQFDARILSDEDFSNQVTKAKYDLLDAYAAGKLRPEVRDRVERSILNNPGKSARLRFTLALSALRERSEKAAAPAHRSSLRWRPRLAAAIALACIAALIAGVIYLRVSAPRRPAVQLTANATPDEKSGPAFVLLLGADVTRGLGSPRQVLLPSNLKHVEVQVVLSAEDAGPDFAVRVRDAKGRLIGSRDGLAPGVLFSHRVLQLDLPAKDLPPGTYNFEVITPQKRLAASYTVSIQRSPHHQPLD